MAPDLTTNPYLQQEVLSVSPIRLRWMLVKRAEELCLLVSKLWEEDKHEESIQWLIRIRDILCELLDGVVDRENPVSQSVSDFYVFLMRLLSEIDREHSPRQLQLLRELLAVEGETWRLAVERFERDETEGVGASQATPAAKPQPIPLPNAGGLHAFVDAPHTAAGGFSLEI